MGFIGASDGSRMARSTKREIPMDLLQAVKVSQEGDSTPVLYGFSDEAEAKGLMLKLRTHLNGTDRGLVASKPALDENGEWVVEFKVTEGKRDVSRLESRTPKAE